MAPEKDFLRTLDQSEKLLSLWSSCTKAEKVPTNFVSLFAAERHFGITVKVGGQQIC